MPCNIVVGLEGIYVLLCNRGSQTEEDGDRLLPSEGLIEHKICRY